MKRNVKQWYETKINFTVIRRYNEIWRNWNKCKEMKISGMNWKEKLRNDKELHRNKIDAKNWKEKSRNGKEM